MLPRLASDLDNELGLLTRLLRLRSYVGRCRVLESALLAHESQELLATWREQALRRAIEPFFGIFYCKCRDNGELPLKTDDFLLKMAHYLQFEVRSRMRL